MSKSENPILSSSKIGRRSFLKMAALGSASFGAGNLLAKEENIKVIFYQEEIDSSQSEAFAEEIGGKTIQLAPLAADYINNLKNMAQTMAEAMQ